MQIETAKITLEQYFSPKEMALVKELYKTGKDEYEKESFELRNTQRIPFPVFNVWVKGKIADKEFGRQNKLTLFEIVGLQKLWESLKVPKSADAPVNPEIIKPFNEWLTDYKNEWNAISATEGTIKPSLSVYITEKLKKTEQQKNNVVANEKKAEPFMQRETLGFKNKNLVYGATFLGAIYLIYRILK